MRNIIKKNSTVNIKFAKFSFLRVDTFFFYHSATSNFVFFANLKNPVLREPGLNFSF